MNVWSGNAERSPSAPLPLLIGTAFSGTIINSIEVTPRTTKLFRERMIGFSLAGNIMLDKNGRGNKHGAFPGGPFSSVFPE
jgi:hypothetical protein